MRLTGRGARSCVATRARPCAGVGDRRGPDMARCREAAHEALRGWGEVVRGDAGRGRAPALAIAARVKGG
jgi:hypothetical protein